MKGLPIARLSVVTVIIAVFYFQMGVVVALNKPEINCTAGEGLDKNATLSCYTCLGRDSENCDWGTVCCKGSCFKLIDKDHDLIIKGCTDEPEEDGSSRVWETNITLYWANNETVHGQAHYCNEKNYCNQGSSAISNVMMLLLTLGVLQSAVSVLN